MDFLGATADIFFLAALAAPRTRAQPLPPPPAYPPKAVRGKGGEYDKFAKNPGNCYSRAGRDENEMGE
ncbi:hypothetical protein GWI33_004625 [Rhynchophorus ferrugineus]|uniref:Uncharacterized protein n=1 Tax=Rhynchophorus ferrugineus TaxID=354439 RepID=A0A834IYP0_RHYFE|nr:hypothetical protein GWI33_004625 [Rhynchophorus ferrugineus]